MATIGPVSRCPSRPAREQRHRTGRRLLAFAAVLFACEPSRDPSPHNAAPPAVPPAASPLRASGGTPDTGQERRQWLPKPETNEAIGKIRSQLWRAFPQPATPQRLAFFANNLGFVARDAVEVVPITAARTPNPCRPHRWAELEPREVTTLADQMLLVIGARKTLVIDSNCQTTHVLAKVSYLPGNRLWQEPRWPNAFSLFDAQSGSLARFRWGIEAPVATGIWLPESTLDDPNLKAGACTLMPDASLACVRDDRIFVGWPGYLSREVGSLEHGAPVVRLLPAERSDHVRVLRDDATLEEYWLAQPARKMRSYALPSVPFDVARGRGFLAVLQIDPATPNSNEIRLAVLETDGALRWVKTLDRTTSDLPEQQRVREYFECRSIAAHPARPWIAVSNCESIELYHAQSGQLLQRTPRAAL